MSQNENTQSREWGRNGLWRFLIAPSLHEIVRTVLLLALLIASVWGLLEIFRGSSGTGSWPVRLLESFAGAWHDKDGLPIAPRFVPAALRSMAIVLTASLFLGLGALVLGCTFAVYSRWSFLRLPLSLFSAVPAFMFSYIGASQESSLLWPAIGLALGDLNAAAMIARCYEGVRRELNQPYIRTARAQGLTVWSDLWPRTTLIALEAVCARLPHLIGGTVAIEFAFNIHGLGQMALTSVLASRPDYNVLVWIAGLGIIATRLLGLVHRIARHVLTPERDRPTPWSERAPSASLFGLGARPMAVQRSASHEPRWLSSTTDAEVPGPPSSWSRRAQRVRAYWNLSISNRLKVMILAVNVCAGCLLTLLSLWGGGYSMLETSEPRQQCSWRHPLGTNDSGEDMLSAIALGGREMALPLITAVTTAVVLGGIFGTLSGLCLGSIADTVMDLYSELWESVPKLVVVLASITFISYTAYSIKLYLVLGLCFVPLLFRAVRDEVGAMRTSLFIEAALTLGVSRWRLFWTHIFRNHALPVLCVEGTVLVGYLLLFDAILGYCGVRQRGEVFTWGNLLGTGLDDLTRLLDAKMEANPMVAWGPLVATLMAIACVTSVGEAIKSLGRSVRFSQGLST